MTESTIVSRQWSRLAWWPPSRRSRSRRAARRAHGRSSCSLRLVQTRSASPTRSPSMLQRGELDLARVDTDPLLAGRTQERLVQRPRGCRSSAAVVMRQVDRDAVRTIFGRIYQEWPSPCNPHSTGHCCGGALSRPLAVRGGRRKRPRSASCQRRGGYVLVWRMTVRSGIDVRDVSINAATGAVELERSQLRRQLPNIGTGKGTGGDDKKVPASASSQGFVPLTGRARQYGRVRLPRIAEPLERVPAERPARGLGPRHRQRQHLDGRRRRRRARVPGLDV